MRQRFDGSVQSSNVPTHQNAGRPEDNGLYRCMVTNVIYVGDSKNITNNSRNPRVLYDCIILGGFSSGQILSNCRLSSLFGGDNTYFERTLKASTKDLTKDRLQNHDGDIVWVLFNQGHSAYPIIISLDEGLNTGSATGAKKSEGPRLKSQYNGVLEEINNSGEWFFTRKGGTLEGGNFTPGSDFEGKMSWTDGTMLWEDTNNSIKLEKEAKKITHKAGDVTIVQDGTSNNVTITAGGTTAVIDGDGSKITLTAGATIIEIDGNSGKISLQGDFIDVGKVVTDFAVLFLQLKTAFDTHTHQYTDDGTPAVTMPPIAPLLATVGSQTVQVQP